MNRQKKKINDKTSKKEYDVVHCCFGVTQFE